MSENRASATALRFVRGTALIVSCCRPRHWADRAALMPWMRLAGAPPVANCCSRLCWDNRSPIHETIPQTNKGSRCASGDAHAPHCFGQLWRIAHAARGSGDANRAEHPNPDSRERGRAMSQTRACAGYSNHSLACNSTPSHRSSCASIESKCLDKI